MLAFCPRNPPGSTVLRINLKAALINRCLSMASSQGDNPCLFFVCFFPLDLGYKHKVPTVGWGVVKGKKKKDSIDNKLC